MARTRHRTGSWKRFGRGVRAAAGIALLALLVLVPLVVLRPWRQPRATTRPVSGTASVPRPATHEEAVAALRFALREAPENVAARVLLARAHLERGALRLARAEAEVAISTGRAPALAYRVRAFVREAAGDFPGAELDRGRVLARAPDDPAAWVEAARTAARYATLAWCPERAAKAAELAAEARRLERAAELGPSTVDPSTIAPWSIDVPRIPPGVVDGAAPPGARAALAVDVLALLATRPPDVPRARALVAGHLAARPACPRGRFLGALVDAVAGAYDGALRELERLDAQFPDHDDVRRTLGRVQQAALATAAPELDGHTPPVPLVPEQGVGLPDPGDAAEVCLARGRILLDAGEATLARVWFERACARGPESLAAWAHLAECLAAVDARETVLAVFARCDRHEPGAPTAPYFLGAFLLAAGEAPSAYDQFEVAHARAPDDTDVLRALTVAAVAAGRQARVASHLSASQAPCATLLRAVVAESCGDVEDAASLYRASVFAGWEVDAALAGLARLGQACPPGAEPGSSEPHGAPGAALSLERGLAELRAGRVESARPLIERAAAAAPTSLRARLAALCVARESGTFAAACDELEREARTRPRDPLPRFLLGTAAAADGRRDDARRAYLDALRRDPRCGVAANGLAWLLTMDLGRPTEALPYARAAKRALPGDPRVADTLGWTLLLLGDGSGAVAELERAARALPSDAGVRRRLRRARASLTANGDPR